MLKLGMSLVDQVTLPSLPEIGEDTSEELPELLQASHVSPAVQAGDIILLRPPNCKARWPGLVDTATHKPKRGKNKSRGTRQPVVKRSLRIKNLTSDATPSSAYSNEILTVHLLNFPKSSQVRRIINPPSQVEFYSTDKQKSIYSEWRKSKHFEYVPDLMKAIEEAESYIRKRVAHTLNPGTPVEQYMQVKRSRLDFDFKGLEHTDVDKQLRMGDISTNDVESNDKSMLSACLGSPESDSSVDKDSDTELFDNSTDSRPNLNGEQFKLLTERIDSCREILRAIYLGNRHSSRHKAYFCSNREDKNLLHMDHLSSFETFPYILDNGQKYEIHDIMVSFANEFVKQDPRENHFSVASYAYDVLLPECTNWLTLELEKNPIETD